MNQILAVICDQSCVSPNYDRSLIDQQVKTSPILDKVIFLNQPCHKKPSKKITLKADQRVVFGGCPILEDSGFYQQTAQHLGLDSAQYSAVDVKSFVLDAYCADSGLEQHLIRKLESQAHLLAGQEKIDETEIQTEKAVLVYGDGYSGLQAALQIAESGSPVDLVATGEPLSPGCLHLQFDPEFSQDGLRAQVQDHELVAVFPMEQVDLIETIEAGFLWQGRRYGSILFAPERLEAPSPEIGALNLSQLYQKERLKGQIVFVLDHGAETPPAVFRDVLEAAVRIKSAAEVWVLIKQARVSLQGNEELYDRCREMGVVFVKYSNLQIQNTFGDFVITGRDPQSGADFSIEKPDRVVLPGAMVLSETTIRTARMLGLKVNEHTQTNSLWLLPNESNRPGIFVAGSARKHMDPQQVQADAASTALAIQQRIEGLAIEETIPIVDRNDCAYCLTCVRACPFGAMGKDREQRVAQVVKTVCRGCGICAAVCPAEAIELRNLNTATINAGLEALSGKE